MDKTVDVSTRPATGTGNAWSSIGMLVAALLSAPCFVGIVLMPVGLAALAASALFMFLDEYRYGLMVIAVILLAVSHWGLRYAREFRPTKLVWTLTVLSLLLIAAELFVDPPWDRHARVPM